MKTSGRGNGAQSRRVVARLALGAVVFAAVPAIGWADDSAAKAESPPALRLDELPPLPAPEEGDASSEVALAAARDVEEDVVSGAAKRDQSVGTVASAVTVISADRLRRFGYRSPSEVLRSVAGLYVQDSRMSEHLGFRGLQVLGDFNTRTLVLVDGFTLNEPWNQFGGIGLDLPVRTDEISRIEVIRGPVSSLYGTNAFFGIVNIITRGADQSPRARGSVGGDSLGTLHGGASFSDGDVDRQIRGAVGYARGGGETLSIPAFVADGGSAQTSADGFDAVHGALVARAGGVFAQMRAYQRRRELAGAPYDSAPGDPDNKNIDRHVLAEVGYTRELDDRLTATGRAFFNRYQFQDFLVYQPEMANFRDVGDSTWAGAELRARYEIAANGRLGATAGAEAVWNNVESRSFDEGDEAGGVVVPTRFDVQGLYAELDGAPTSWLGFSAGLRLDRHSLFEENLSPRAALFAHRGDRYGAKMLFADGFRYPSAYEAFFRDDTDFESNPQLTPERIRSYEAVLWSRPRAGLNLRLSGFLWELEDIIEQEEVTVGPDSRLQFQNIGQVQSAGLEAEASYRDARGWLGFASLSFSRVTRDGDESAAVNAPRWTASGGVSSPLLRQVAHLSTDLSFVSSRRTRFPGQRAAAHVLWNCAIYVPAWRSVDLTIGVRNLLGKRDEQPAAEDFDRTNAAGETVPFPVIPGVGRTIFANAGLSY